MNRKFKKLCGFITAITLLADCAKNAPPKALSRAAVYQRSRSSTIPSVFYKKMDWIYADYEKAAAWISRSLLKGPWLKKFRQTYKRKPKILLHRIRNYTDFLLNCHLLDYLCCDQLFYSDLLTLWGFRIEQKVTSDHDFNLDGYITNINQWLDKRRFLSTFYLAIILKKVPEQQVSWVDIYTLHKVGTLYSGKDNTQKARVSIYNKLPDKENHDPVATFSELFHAAMQNLERSDWFKKSNKILVGNISIQDQEIRSVHQLPLKFLLEHHLVKTPKVFVSADYFPQQQSQLDNQAPMAGRSRGSQTVKTWLDLEMRIKKFNASPNPLSLKLQLRLVERPSGHQVWTFSSKLQIIQGVER